MTCRPRDLPANPAITAPHYAGRILNMGYSNNLRHFPPPFPHPSPSTVSVSLLTVRFLPTPMRFSLTRDRLAWAWKFLSRENPLWVQSLGQISGIGDFSLSLLVSCSYKEAWTRKFCKVSSSAFWYLFHCRVIDSVSLLAQVFTIITWFVARVRDNSFSGYLISAIFSNKTKCLVTLWKNKELKEAFWRLLKH